MKNVTIKDIANRLSVSVSTVSRALADDKNIRKETKQQIVETAADMGYKRNNVAAILRTGRTFTIGVIVNETTTSYASQVLEGIQSVLHEAGYHINFADSHDSVEQERQNLKMMENALVDGIIVAPCQSSANLEEFRRLINSGRQIVFFGRSLKDLEVPKVIANDYDKAYYLTEHLIRSGCTRIVHVSGPKEVDNYSDITRGYQDCLKKFKVPYDNALIVESEISVNGGYQTADHLIENKIDFDSIFACCDLLAICIMNRLRHHGLRIPQDVSVAGFSGSTLSQLVYPTLTTVEPPLREMGEKVAKLMLKRIKNPGSETETIVVDSRIQTRESTNRDSRLHSTR